MAEVQLMHGMAAEELRPGWVSLGVPIHEGAVVVGSGPGPYPKGRISVRLEGSSVDCIEVWRQDDPTVLGEPSAPLQVEIIKPEEAVREWPVFARPVGSLVFRKLEDDVWVAQAEALEVLELGGLSWFASVLMDFALKKQKPSNFQRPTFAVPELV